MLGSKKAMVPVGVKALPARRQRAAFKPAAVAMAGAVGEVPDMQKRNLMNLLLLGAVGLPATSLVGGFAYFFVPPSAGGGGGGIAAKDKLGNDIKASEWLKTHLPNDHTLAQGLKGDPTYV